MTGTVAPNIPTKGDALGTSDKKTRESLTTLRDAHNELLTSENLVEKAKLEKAAKPVTWYAPKIIATEQSRESTSFGTLTTADEIKEVALPENGLLLVGYMATFKSSAEGKGRAAIFLNANQLKVNAAIQEAATTSTTYRALSTSAIGLGSSSELVLARATTGEAIAGVATEGGLCPIWAAAGTYNISVQYRALTSGSVTAKERKLWVAVLGS